MYGANGDTIILKKSKNGLGQTTMLPVRTINRAKFKIKTKRAIEETRDRMTELAKKMNYSREVANLSSIGSRTNFQETHITDKGIPTKINLGRKFSTIWRRGRPSV